MKQVLQNLGDGSTNLADVPCPQNIDGHLLIRSSRSLVSPGTERMLVEFGKANLIDKARQQPDKVRMVLDKVKTDGLVPTFEAVRDKLDQPLALGYCNVGRVIAVGDGVSGFAIGDRVVSNGKHAEIVSVPTNLCAKISDAVEDDAAAFTVLGAIALQGIRLTQPTLGECIVVTGLGLIGLLAVQLLRSHGCRVLGIDYDRGRLDLARRHGAEIVDLSAGEDPIAAAVRFSRGRGVDAVLISATTKSSEPVHQAALMCRKRGRIVLIGVTGLELSRADFYEKELTFQVSCSYGPGRYDPDYEVKGQDYPIAFVRWTEQRNFEAVLDMMADRRLGVASLISHRFPIGEAAKAYAIIASDPGSLGILLEYSDAHSVPDERLTQSSISLAPTSHTAGSPSAVVSFIGAGNHATRVLIPAFKAAGAELRHVVSSGGVSGVHAGRKFGFAEVTTDAHHALDDSWVTAVVIATRHDSHARLAIEALQAGKNVFVEKPLCLTADELVQIEAAWRAKVASGFQPLLMVGFNRRFAPQIRKIKQLLSSVRSQKSFVMTVNAGAVPPGHWTLDPHQGGGRIIGEACHFVDLLRFLSGSPITAQHRTSLGSDADTATLDLAFADGSVGTVHYFANGNRAFPKERLEIFCEGRVLQLDNFRKLRGFGWPGFRAMNLWTQDKGQRACAAAFVAALTRGGAPPIPFDELVEVSRATLALAK